MHICLCIDACYLQPCAVTIASLARFKAIESEFWVVVSGQFDPAMRNCLAAAAMGCPLHILNVTEGIPTELSSDPRAQHVSEAMYLKILLADLLPNRVARFLYLDADILAIRDDFGQLGSRPLSQGLAAVRDQFTQDSHADGGIPGVSFDSTQCWPYFNSGVLLVDRQRYLKAGVIESALDYLTRNANSLRFPDQDALNAVFAGEWSELPRRFNYMRFRDFDSVGFLDPFRATFIHSAGSKKPWSPERAERPDGLMFSKVSDWIRSRSSDGSDYATVARIGE